MSRSPDRARQATREEVEDVDKVVVEERGGFAIMDVKVDGDDDDDNKEEDDTEEGFAIVVVKVVKPAGVAAQAHVR